MVKLLPPPKLTNLQDLARRIALVNPSQREGVALELQEEEFISELRESFHSAEAGGVRRNGFEGMRCMRSWLREMR